MEEVSAASADAVAGSRPGWSRISVTVCRSRRRNRRRRRDE